MLKLDKKQLIGVIAGLIMIAGDLIFLIEDRLFYLILVLALIIIAFPFIISVIVERGRKKDIETRFLEFVRDLVENVKSGTPISKGIVNLRHRDYGALSVYIEKLINQVLLGIPLTKALFIFAKDTQSPVVLRSVNLISEAEKAGGEIDTILESVANSVNQTEELRKERQSAVYNLIVQGYIVFIVFIIIMLVLQFKILPMTEGLGGDGAGPLSIGVKTLTGEQFATPMFILLLVQAFFAGFVIGKISEGSFKDGIKHSFILLTLALLIFTGARAFLG